MLIYLYYNKLEWDDVMYKSRNKKKINVKIMAIIGVIAVVILLAVSVHMSRSSFLGEGIIKDVVMTIDKIVMYPFTALNDEKNVTQTESYLIQKNVNASLEQEIQELKDALDLNSTLTEYTPINATILSRNKSYWFNQMMIDKGSSDGIQEDMAVVTKNGLIGKISRVYRHSSEIKLITSDDVNYKVSVAIKTGDGDSYAILNGYDADTECVMVTGVDKMSTVKKGDTIVTSGLGGMFPGGIYVGVVEDIKSDKYDLSKTLYIRTSQDFNNIHYVTVLKEKE